MSEEPESGFLLEKDGVWMSARLCSLLWADFLQDYIKGPHRDDHEYLEMIDRGRQAGLKWRAFRGMNTNQVPTIAPTAPKPSKVRTTEIAAELFLHDRTIRKDIYAKKLIPAGRDSIGYYFDRPEAESYIDVRRRA